MALFAYRSNQTVFEPNKQASMQLDIVGKVHLELISTEEEIAQLKKLSPDNPQISALESTADLLRRTIASETEQVTSPGRSFSARAPVFERLELDVEFADKQLAGALAGMEDARSEAQRKQIYLERLTQPNAQDKSMEPRRIRSILTTFIISLLAWGVAGILIASVRGGLFSKLFTNREGKLGKQSFSKFSGWPTSTTRRRHGAFSPIGRSSVCPMVRAFIAATN